MTIVQLFFLAVAFFLLFTSPRMVTYSNHRMLGIALVSLQIRRMHNREIFGRNWFYGQWLVIRRILSQLPPDD